MLLLKIFTLLLKAAENEIYVYEWQEKALTLLPWQTLNIAVPWLTISTHSLIEENSQFTTNTNSNFETFQRLDDCRVRLDWDTVALWLTLTARHFSLTSPVPGQRLTQRSLHSVQSHLSWTAANRSMTLVCNLGAKGRLPRSVIHLESVYSDFPPLVVFPRIIDPVLPIPPPDQTLLSLSPMPGILWRQAGNASGTEGGADVEASSMTDPRHYLAPIRAITHNQ